MNIAAAILKTTYPTASRLVSGLEDFGILEEITGRKRSRIYRYEPYVSLFDDQPDPETESSSPGVTKAAAPERPLSTDLRHNPR